MNDPAAEGLRVRREVAGDAWVDAAMGNPLTAEFQDLIINRYVWGEIWTRPVLDRRTRSVITLTALVAGGQHEELAVHLLGARRNGLSDAEIVEVVMQCAIYCGVPAANSAMRVVARVLGETETSEV